MQSLRRSARSASTAQALQKSSAVVTAALETSEPRSKRAKRSQPVATTELGTTTSNSGGVKSVKKVPQGISRYYEKQQWDKGFKAVAGVDEAGRGPLAGPVVAAACIIPATVDIKGIDDSKKLSEEEREELYELITSHPEIIWAVKAVDVETIDEINILEAAMQAMELAVSDLNVVADFVLVDGNRLPKKLEPSTSIAITKGDAKVYAIAAASIIAKVTRDRMMLELHAEYPQYEFNLHKGYGTALHTAAIRKHGPCPAHRRSFNPVRTWFYSDDVEEEDTKSTVKAKAATKGKPKKT